MKLIVLVRCSAYEGHSLFYWYSRKKDDVFYGEQIVSDFESFRNDELIMLPTFRLEELAKSFLREEGYGYLIDYMDNVASQNCQDFCVEFRRFLEVSTHEYIRELNTKWQMFFYEKGAAAIMNWIEENHIPYER